MVRWGNPELILIKDTYMKLILNDGTIPEEVITLYLTINSFGDISLEARSAKAPFSPKTLLRFRHNGTVETVHHSTVGNFNFDSKGRLIVEHTT